MRVQWTHPFTYIRLFQHINNSLLQAITTKVVVRELKTPFARFGVPETLVTNDDPTFAFKECEAFAKS